MVQKAGNGRTFAVPHLVGREPERAQEVAVAVARRGCQNMLLASGCGAPQGTVAVGGTDGVCVPLVEPAPSAAALGNER